MAETSKTFWGKFKKSKLKINSHSRVPTTLIEMFPSKDSDFLFQIYSKCNNDIAKTVEYMTKNQASNFYDEVPLEILIESLKFEKSVTKTIKTCTQNRNYFDLTPTHILSYIFTFLDINVLGKITQINRECRLLSKAILCRTIEYDFSSYYHKYCQIKQKRFSHSNSYYNSSNLRLIYNDDIKLISHINAFPYLNSLSLRSTYFSKWYNLKLIINRNNICNLNLSSSINLYDDDINIILDILPSIKILNLSSCLEISDLSCTYIVENENIRDLYKLCLNNLPLITKNGIKQLIKYKKTVTQLECKNSRFGSLNNVFDNGYHLNYLNLINAKNLRRLVLEYNTNTQNVDSSFNIDLGNCKLLTFIDLKIGYLTQINLTQCLNLKEIRISYAVKLREINCRNCKLLELVSIPTASIQIINISGCSSLNIDLLLNSNNAIIQSIDAGSLYSLDMTHINNINDDDIDIILDANSNSIKHSLKSFSVNYCKQLSKNKINWINSWFNKPQTISNRAKKRQKRILNRKSRKYSC